LIGQRTAQKITRAIKAQNGQPTLARAAARRGQVVKQVFLAQDSVDRLGQRGAFARAKAAVLTEKPRHNGVSWMVKFEGQTHQFRTGVKQGFWMHSGALSHGNFTQVYPSETDRKHRLQHNWRLQLHHSE